MFEGKTYIRMDDTNPKKESLDYEQDILKVNNKHTIQSINLSTVFIRIYNGLDSVQINGH